VLRRLKEGVKEAFELSWLLLSEFFLESLLLKMSAPSVLDTLANQLGRLLLYWVTAPSF
jgi:hypothetical protein